MKGRHLQELVMPENRKKVSVFELVNKPYFGRSFDESFTIEPGTWIKKVDRVNYDLTLTLNQFNYDSS